MHGRGADRPPPARKWGWNTADRSSSLPRHTARCRARRRWLDGRSCVPSTGAQAAICSCTTRMAQRVRGRHRRLEYREVKYNDGSSRGTHGSRGRERAGRWHAPASLAYLDAPVTMEGLDLGRSGHVNRKHVFMVYRFTVYGRCPISKRAAAHRPVSAEKKKISTRRSVPAGAGPPGLVNRKPVFTVYGLRFTGLRISRHLL